MSGNYSVTPINEKGQYVQICNHHPIIPITMNVKAEDLDDLIRKLTQARDLLNRE